MESTNPATPAKPASPRTADTERPGWTRTNGQHIRILIVDDHTIFRQLLRRWLEQWQEVEVVGDAVSGREAVSAVEKLMPDVVLMDMVMPGLAGVEATRQIRKRFPSR